ncbi:MAG: thioredoxin family protein, partial [Candidatus Eisenbacteria bacterium]
MVRGVPLLLPTLLFALLAPAAAFAAAGPAAPRSFPATLRSGPGPALKGRLDSLVAAESRVRWERLPPDSAIARAARQGRPAFLDFFADWCVPCRWMDRAVYSDPLLGEVAEGLAMVRIDIETRDGRALAERYRVSQYPTLVYLAADGREILRWPGPLNLRDTRLNLGQVSLPSGARAAVEAERAKRPRDAATQSRALLWYGWRGEVERVRAIVDTLERGRARAGPHAASEGALLQLSLAKAEEIAGRRERALAAYRRALAYEPEGVFAWRAWLGVSAALDQAGDAAGAEAAAREA